MPYQIKCDECGKRTVWKITDVRLCSECYEDCSLDARSAQFKKKAQMIHLMVDAPLAFQMLRKGDVDGFKAMQPDVELPTILGVYQ